MSDYIMDLRKIVGHRPLLQVGASVIVEDALGRILLQLRSDNHCWGYAGGSVELDEVVEDAASENYWKKPVWLLRNWICLVFSQVKIVTISIPMVMRFPMWTLCMCAENTPAPCGVRPVK